MQVAVIVPAYNSAHFLRQSIDSVLAQTYAAAEILVVDDGSTDNTREVVESYPPPVRYCRRPNRGPSAARNTGVRETTSPWVAFLDADDWWEPRKLGLQRKALDRAPDAVLCYTSTAMVRSDGVRLVVPAASPNRLWPELRYLNPITPSTVIMRRDVFEEVGGFDEDLRGCEDWDLWFRIGPQRRMVAVDEPLTCYRLTDSSLSMDFDRMLSEVGKMLARTHLKDLRGWEHWAWGRRAWSAELARCAIIASDARSPRAVSLILRSLLVWPSPFFEPRRWRQLMVYLIRGTRRTVGNLVNRDIRAVQRLP